MTSGPAATGLRPFDIELFMSRKLGGVFTESEDAVGVIVLIPPQDQSDVDTLLGDLAELEGYTHVSDDVVASAADRFAADQTMEPIDGEWIGFGLIPRYADSPTADWVSTLSSIPDAKVAVVDYHTATPRIPEDWTVVADLPVQLESGAIVEMVGDEIVVLQSQSTVVIRPDGSFETRDAPPISIPADCCGETRGLPAGHSLVFAGSSQSWILNPHPRTWRQADPRPHSGSVLGSAFIEDDLFVVTAAARSGEATSSLAGLDITTGQWRELEPAPHPISVGGVTADGERLIVAGTRQDGNNNVIGDRKPVAYQYTSAEGWRELPSVPIDGQASTVVWVEGTGLLAWNYDLQSALLDESGVWRELGGVPMPPSECYPISHPTAVGVVGLCGGIAVFDATAESWRPIPGAFDTRYVVTDTALIGLVPIDRDQTTLITYLFP